ncbi:MAG: ABC transporter ATP-binding protein [Armatimonadota bacterium]|nr:ABC transporter ATP-binding protein [Armatimonadota bacterium]MDR5698076.1 ABC transporter ATP-binding protein [Armatimonadota bacterium]
MLLEVRDIRKRFGGVIALDGVSFTVTERERLGLIGPNGAGKTTLFHVVSGFLRPDGGRVVFAGRDVTGIPAHRVCRLGLVRTFQIVQPFAQMTVLDNVTVSYLYGRYGRGATVGQARAQARRILHWLHLDDLADQPADSLNLPERKRLEMARALGTGPRLLCLDEVMAGLVQEDLEHMAQTVRRLNEELGLTIVMVEHNVRLTARLCDRVVVLDQGRLIADGPPEAVMADPQVVRAYLGERRAEVLGA